jgi:hypothetical protein
MDELVELLPIENNFPFSTSLIKTGSSFQIGQLFVVGSEGLL